MSSEHIPSKNQADSLAMQKWRVFLQLPRKRMLILLVSILASCLLMIYFYPDSLSSAQRNIQTSPQVHIDSSVKASPPERPQPTCVPPTSTSTSTFTSTSTHQPSPPSPQDFLPWSALAQILQPPRTLINATTFVSRDAVTYRLPNKPTYNTPLGKKVLILDVDTRPLNEPGDLFSQDGLNANNLGQDATGRLSHYLYATIHGYDYKLVQETRNPDRHGTWLKVAAMKDALKDYQFVVFMDADAIFTYSHLPIEWLLNHWEISDKTLIALAEDPSRNVHLDEDGQIELNTGFMIAQSSSRTLEMFEAWDSCPDGNRYKDCSRWKEEWSHEQDAFSDYIRHDFNRPEDIKVITCKEGNRFPGNGQDENCEGSFVEHYWQAKDKLPWGVQQSIWQWLVPQLGESFRQHENALGMPKLAGLNETGSEQTGSNSDGSDSSGWNNTGLNQTNDAGLQSAEDEEVGV